MPVRATRGDDQAVGEGASFAEVDEDDVLGLLVVQAAQDQLFERRPILALRGGRMGAVVRRAGRGIKGQRRLLK